MDKILFFDGTCAMCNGLVNFIIKHDKKKLFKFAPLQGTTAEKYLPSQLRSELSTAVFLDKNGIHLKSDALLDLLADLGGIFRLMQMAKIVPKALRDRIYDHVARNRYSWFGHNDRCALMNKEDQKRLLE